jgi:hypothetical protein
MNPNKKTAIIVGILFIIGTVAGILSAILTGPILNGSNYLMKISVKENQITIGALFVLMMGLTLAMVPVMMFPIFKKYNETLALGYVVFRGALETITYIAVVIDWLFLGILGQEYAKAGVSGASYFQTLGALLLKGNDSINVILEIIFPLGALMFYYLFYQSKLIPRWLSGWGFIATVLYLAAGLYNMFGPELEVLFFPLALQEMVMAVWLIVKGFNPSEVAFESVKTVSTK